MTRYEQMDVPETQEELAEFMADMLYESISPQRYSPFIDCEAIFREEQKKNIMAWLNEPAQDPNEGA